MQKHDKNPDSEEMQESTCENQRAVFAAKMMGFTAIESKETTEEPKGYSKDHIWINY